ncbi:MAG: PEP-CTERM sorting domain-containing protein [Steroidobacteraceae bacterium]
MESGRAGCELEEIPAEDAGGVRGSLDVIDGWVLTTASPAYLSFLTPSFDATEFVPFVISSAAPGDSLSIYGPSGVLWSQPLSDFTPDDLYFAQIPAEPGDYGAPVALTYYVHNDTESEHSSVWLPDVNFTTNTTTAVPEPSTLCLIGLGFAALGLSRRKRRHL